MKRDASPGSVHDAGCLGLVRWEGPGGWYGEVGREEGSGWKKKKNNKNKIMSFKNKRNKDKYVYWQLKGHIFSLAKKNKKKKKKKDSGI